MSSPQQILGQSAVETLPSISDAKMHLVRISLRNGAEAARHDYGILKDENAQGKETLWDKDARNKIHIGDWLGFIVGENGDEVVELYQVVGEAPVSKRPVHWKRIESYTNQETTTKPIARELIVLSSDNPTQMEWSDWKRKVDYKDKYMPRGTTSAKNPFSHDTTTEQDAVLNERIFPRFADVWTTSPASESVIVTEGSESKDELGDILVEEESVHEEGEGARPEEDGETTASMIEVHPQLITDLTKEIRILSELSGYGTLPEIQRRLSLLHKMMCAI